jgi:hypothetical protein
LHVVQFGQVPAVHVPSVVAVFQQTPAPGVGVVGEAPGGFVHVPSYCGTGFADVQ